jgi:RHS repeat-associated protein
MVEFCFFKAKWSKMTYLRFVKYSPVNSSSSNYPFGMQILERSWTASSYRFGFQDQEKDDEIRGEGNSISYEYRIHDTRLGRFSSIDPLFAKYPFYSPYSFSGNRLIDAVELEGLEPGVLFATQDAAATNFGQLFNDNSIRDNREYGTKIYSVTSGGVTQFTYAVPVVGQPAGLTNIQMGSLNVPTSGTVTAFAHTHAASTVSAPVGSQFQDNIFSGTPGTPAAPGVPAVPGTVGDIGWAEAQGIDGYVATPNGSLQKYDITTKAVTTLSTTMPSDSGPGTGVAGTSAKSTDTYTIKPGDNLTTIAKRYKTTVSAIASENSLADPNKIIAGKTLNVTN